MTEPGMVWTVAAGRRPRDAEVHQQRVLLGVDHDVGRLQIAVDDAGPVRGGEAGHDLPRQRQDARQRQLRLPLQQGRRVRPLHIRHREIERALDLAQVMDADDVRVGDLAGELELALEAVFELPVPPAAVGSTRMSFSATAVPRVSSQA